jgi:hypothetical protein
MGELFTLSFRIRFVNFEDIQHYQKIIVALKETVMGEIDGVGFE